MKELIPIVLLLLITSCKSESATYQRLVDVRTESFAELEGWCDREYTKEPGSIYFKRNKNGECLAHFVPFEE